MGEKIDGIYRPSDEEQNAADKVMTDEQRKAGYERAGKVWGIRDRGEQPRLMMNKKEGFVAYRKEPIEGDGRGSYRLDKRIWVSPEGKFFLKHGMAEGGDFRAVTRPKEASEEISRDRALEEINQTLDYLNSRINLAQDEYELARVDLAGREGFLKDIDADEETLAVAQLFAEATTDAGKAHAYFEGGANKIDEETRNAVEMVVYAKGGLSRARIRIDELQRQLKELQTEKAKIEHLK